MDADENPTNQDLLDQLKLLKRENLAVKKRHNKDLKAKRALEREIANLRSQNEDLKNRLADRSTSNPSIVTDLPSEGPGVGPQKISENLALIPGEYDDPPPSEWNTEGSSHDEDDTVEAERFITQYKETSLLKIVKSLEGNP